MRAAWRNIAASGADVAVLGSAMKVVHIYFRGAGLIHLAHACVKCGGTDDPGI